MNKRDKAIIKLLGMIAGQLAVIATNIIVSNADKIAYGARKANMFEEAHRILKSNVDEIDKVVEEATNEQD